MQTKSKLIKKGAAALGFAILVGADQLTKYCAVNFLKGSPSLVCIPGVFELTYLENRGAAWGILENCRWIFLLLTLVVLGAFIYGYHRSENIKKYGTLHVLMLICASGAVGNAIDRAFYGYVVDFLYFSLIDFPVFNLADCYVTVSIALALLIYRKEVIEWIKKES